MTASSSADSAGDQIVTRAVDAAPQFPGAFADWWQVVRTADGIDPSLALLAGVVVVVLAYGVDLGLRRAAAPWLARVVPAEDARFPLRDLVRWLVLRSLLLLVFFLVAHGILALFSRGDTIAREITATVIETAVLARAFLSMIELLGRQGAETVADRSRDGIDAVRRALLPTAVAVILQIARNVIALALSPADSMLAPAIVLTVVFSIATIWIFFRVREVGARVFHKIFASADEPGSIATSIAQNWHIAYALVFAISDAVTFAIDVGLVSGVDERLPIRVILMLTPSLVAALRGWRNERLKTSNERKAALVIGIAALAEGAIILLAGTMIIDAWGVRPFAGDQGSNFDQVVGDLLVAAITLVVGLSIWRAVGTVLDSYAPQQSDPTKMTDDEGPAQGASRFATVFPVVRGAILTLIFTVTGMISLAALGVEIGPLLAGAGVVGLAVGFGAQTIVKDIISGMFYLHEDAFRIGEYIETKEGKGIVEKISLRSVRLRHHRGAVFTIPFGSMGTIQNHSRDWVKVKFSLEVPAHEDLEQVRKLVKKVGAALLEDPDIGPSFLEPLKSQGAVGMNGSNYVIGIKFASRPGEQFLIRRKAYVALQRAFAEHGIEVPKPKIVVESTLPPEEAGAAGSALQADAARQGA